MKSRLLIIAMLVSSFSVTAVEHTHWSYDGDEGPDHWGKLTQDFSLCSTGKNQSPVNIQSALKTHHGKLNLTFQPGKQQIANNGHSIQINVSEGNTLTLDNTTYTLQQFHFHSPSENEIDGKRFPLEAHFVYQDNGGALAVLALMFNQGAANTQLAQAWKQMPTDVGKTAALFPPMDIKALLPKKFNYFRFSGSLTTPPCSEGVIWMVLNKPATASAQQISQFTSVIHHTNNRPIQPLNGRIIID
ncbi:carbonic anhydrase [Serratia rhizosphaerae]|uniref:Carbonic anhydrase n=1 Tax=Serratia rhizosphaerae TaxID=2597702 RepID=A0ABX6GMZ4_9GAMM|nr:carbonic anhydrase family protein [Serratia rhizosphaerae]MEB6334133.1 carbonic anhydrase family protein [Serratia rhizosphaerae]QHA87666.1 carbonic anhydrase family protein [Serratia rhizosphaerae]